MLKKIIKTILLMFLLFFTILFIYSIYLKRNNQLPTHILNKNLDSIESVSGVPFERFMVLEAKQYAEYSVIYGDTNKYHRIRYIFVFFNDHKEVLAISEKTIYKFGNIIFFSQTLYKSNNDTTAMILPWPIAF